MRHTVVLVFEEHELQHARTKTSWSSKWSVALRDCRLRYPQEYMLLASIKNMISNKNMFVLATVAKNKNVAACCVEPESAVRKRVVVATLNLRSKTWFSLSYSREVFVSVRRADANKNVFQAHFEFVATWNAHRKHHVVLHKNRNSSRQEFRRELWPTPVFEL